MAGRRGEAQKYRGLEALAAIFVVESLGIHQFGPAGQVRLRTNRV